MAPISDIPKYFLLAAICALISPNATSSAMDVGPYEMDAAHLSKISIETALRASEALLKNAEVGTSEGTYSPESIDQLKAAIDQANTSKSENQIDQLYDSLTEFESSVHSRYHDLIDTKASKETRYLYENLKSSAADSLYFGMQDALGYGVGWRADNRRSDISDVIDELPSVFGWDAFEITHFKTGDSLRDRIEYSYRLGGIQAMCWHAYDPLDESFYQKGLSKEAYSDSVVSDILPGGRHHGVFKSRLDQLAVFFKSLRGPNGESIPLLFRPWHEHNGNWFWWGKPQTDPADFNSLWRFTVEYLRDQKNVRNLIYVFSPDASQFTESEEYFEIYPGNEYVDVFGLDSYWAGIPIRDQAIFTNKIRSLSQFAQQRGKIAAITETGDKFAAAFGGERLANKLWFSQLLESILADDDTRRIAFAMTWRNDNSKHHFNPYPGHSSVSDFEKFYKHPYTRFIKDMPNLYQTPATNL